MSRRYLITGTILELYTPLECFLGPVNRVSDGRSGEKDPMSRAARTNGQYYGERERARWTAKQEGENSL